MQGLRAQISPTRPIRQRDVRVRIGNAHGHAGVRRTAADHGHGMWIRGSAGQQSVVLQDDRGPCSARWRPRPTASSVTYEANGWSSLNHR